MLPCRWLVWAAGLVTAYAANFSQCEKVENDNETCILAESECEVDWPGELVIPEKSTIVCPHIIYTADRFVLRNGAGLSVNHDLKITARTMVIRGEFMYSNSTFLLGKDGVCGGIEVLDFVISASKQIVMVCHGGTVNVTGRSTLEVNTGLHGLPQSGVLYMQGNFVLLPDLLTKLRAYEIKLRAQQLALAASISRGAHLTAMSEHQAMLGWLGGSWTLGSLVMAAAQLLFVSDHRVEVLGNSCDNQAVPKRANPCLAWLSAWPWSEKTLSEALTASNYVKFTSVIFASNFIEVRPRTRILTGSAIFCAGDEILLSEKASVLAQGKGCPANKGGGAGEVRTYFALCGGGGASNLGAGGDGAVRMDGEASLWHCAEKGLITLWDGKGLPLQGASGGGFPKGGRSDLDFSSGGGLLWFCSSLLYMNASSRLRADGMQGTIVGSSPKRAMASGGGAGGQILIFTKEIRVDECVEGGKGCDPPELSVQGGSAHCNSAQPTVGGAGGGGFIGLWWLKGAPKEHEDLGQLVKLDVQGGKLTKSCADLLPQDLHHNVFGRAGLAVSLAPCPSGHAGPFCASCPVGFWGDGQACHFCHNKPKTENAIYKSPAWPNATCPFECAQGVPEVAVNPNCLSAYDFAMGFFGGKLGFQITLAIPITIFFVLRLVQWLRHQGKRKQESLRWHFPREELPCHVARIFFLGNNSPGSPWTLPERTVAVDNMAGAELLQQVVQEEVWQLLGEALQKPLKIGRWESWHLLHLCCCFELLLSRCRLRRAQKAQQRVVEFVGEMWKEMESHKFSMKFGCDDSATTGHLDFFDFNRSALDWAPRNLKEEEQVILAQGAGTWARPYELSVADPMLLGVAQSQGSQGPIGGQMIYSLVCAFNLFSRIVPAQELLDVLWGDDAPAFALLQREVESSARRLSLQVAAQVQILQMSRCHKGQLEEGKKTSDVPAGPESFTDLVQQLPLEGAPKDVSRAEIVEEELRLCLVLRAEKDPRLLRGHCTESRLKKPKGFLHTVRRSLLRFRAQRLLACVRLPAGRFGISNLVLSLVFFMLILFEGMSTVILASTFSRLDIDQALWLWLLFPAPLAPLSPLMGLAALLLRRPKVCRLQAQMSLMAAMNAVVVALFYQTEGLLIPTVLLFLLHVFVSYSAAIYSGLEMSTEDVQLAEDRGGDASMQSLRSDPAPSCGAGAGAGRGGRGSRPGAAAAEEDGICMALWPRSPARPHADSVESDAGCVATPSAAPF